MAQKPIVQTEVARLLYEVQGSTIERLAEQLDVGRQCAGKWVSGREPVPRRRQAQIIFYVEAGEISLFDEDGFAKAAPGFDKAQNRRRAEAVSRAHPRSSRPPRVPSTLPNSIYHRQKRGEL